MKSIPLGVENFREVIQNSYYVDHTVFIEELERLTPTSAVLILRPRRFGKSLTLSMLRFFYESEPCDKEALFRGLKISKNKVLMSGEKKPVLHIKLKDLKPKDYASLNQGFFALIEEEYQRQRSIWGEGLCCPLLDNLKTSGLNESDLQSSLYELSKTLYVYTGQRVYLLIDEYDTPISNAKYYDYFDDAISFFRTLYGKALKGNDFIEKSVVTGILRIAKQSLFSETNNFVLDDGLQTAFTEPCGFTYSECADMLRYYGADESMDKVITWYGGYRFGDTLCVNPWSALSYLFYQRRFATYWVSSASNSELSTVFSAEKISIVSLNRLLGGVEKAKADIAENINYQQIDYSMDSFYLYLRAAGYLSLSEYTDDNGVILRIPNREIEITFPNEIIKRYAKGLNDQRLLSSQIKQAFSSGDESMIQKLFEEELLPSFSYFDFGNEKSYQIMVLTLAALLFENSIIQSEAVVGDGRCDILIAPKNEGGYGAVLEIKYLKARTSQERLQKSAQGALKQVVDNKYCSWLIRGKANPIYAYGISFQGQRVAVSVQRIR